MDNANSSVTLRLKTLLLKFILNVSLDLIENYSKWDNLILNGYMRFAMVYSYSVQISQLLYCIVRLEFYNPFVCLLRFYHKEPVARNVDRFK